MFLKNCLNGGGSAKNFFRLFCSLCCSEIAVKNSKAENISAKRLLEAARIHYPEIRMKTGDVRFLEKYLSTNNKTLNITCRYYFVKIFRPFVLT